MKLKEGQEKPKTKAPKIQRLVTPLVLQRARRVKAQKRARIAKAKSDANEYAKLLALRQKVICFDFALAFVFYRASCYLGTPR